MICRPCRVGADLNHDGYRVAAWYYHLLCDGCDCQHKTGGQWIRE